MTDVKTSTRKQVLSIRSPLTTGEPLYILIDDNSKSIASILIETVTKLEAAGRTQEAVSLEKMLADHKIVVNGVVWDPQLPVSSLTFDTREVDQHVVDLAEIQLMRRYVGGC
ncbi:MAG: hypothetical protein ACFFBD_02555 [Candidatus Hodarchaeota archaeon]